MSDPARDKPSRPKCVTCGTRSNVQAVPRERKPKVPQEETLL